MIKEEIILSTMLTCRRYWFDTGVVRHAAVGQYLYLYLSISISISISLYIYIYIFRQHLQECTQVRAFDGRT